jgi:hypothetical protein
MLGPDGHALHRPLTLSVAGLVLAGAGLAALAAILSLTHHVPAQAPVFAAVMLVLTADAVLILRQVRWAVLVTLVALAGQAIAVAGVIVELASGIAPVKAHQLRQLGFDPTTGVVVNLAYSSLGLAIFCWFAIRWLNATRRARRQLG